MATILSISGPVSHAVVMSVRCNYCSKYVSRSVARRLAGHAQIICDDCIDWHNRSIEVLAGEIPAGCQQCSRSWDLIRDGAIGDDVRMYVVPKDGIYQLLCSLCCMPYLRLRSDFYKDTAFGRTALNL